MSWASMFIHCFETSSVKISTAMENLPNEVFHEIFENLDGYELLIIMSSQIWINGFNLLSILLKCVYNKDKTISIEQRSTVVASFDGWHRLLDFQWVFSTTRIVDTNEFINRKTVDDMFLADIVASFIFSGRFFKRRKKV